MFPQISYPQINNLPVGTRALGMGSTYVALANTAETIFLNPGGMAQIENIELAAFYQKPFGLEDVNVGSMAFILPFSRLSAGLGIIHLSNGLLTEQTVKLAVGKHLHQSLFYGLAVNYSSLEIKNYGATSNVGLDFGLMVRLTEKLRLGFQAQNIIRSKIGKTEQSIPQSLKSGLSFLPTSNLILNLEVFKEVDFDEEIRFGAEYNLFQNLALRLGTASNPDRFSSGFGLNTYPFTIDYAFFSHNDLGLTHQASLTISFGRKKQAIAPPVIEQTPPENVPATPEPKQPKTETAADTILININTADSAALSTLPGIGEKTAAAIINFRTENGDFQKKEDLMLVPGIGAKKLEQILDLITVE